MMFDPIHITPVSLEALNYGISINVDGCIRMVLNPAMIQSLLLMWQWRSHWRSRILGSLLIPLFVNIALLWIIYLFIRFRYIISLEPAPSINIYTDFGYYAPLNQFKFYLCLRFIDFFIIAFIISTLSIFTLVRKKPKPILNSLKAAIPCAAIIAFAFAIFLEDAIDTFLVL